MAKTDYFGLDKVHIGDGQGILIKHIGYSTFLAPHSQKILHLCNLLHVPQIKKNLRSVSQFCLDNNVLFEFHPNVCFVKDWDTKTVVLRGSLKNGLYVFNEDQIPKSHKLLNRSTNSKSCCISVSSTHVFSSIPYVQKLALIYDAKPSDVFELWHKRLGHSSSKIVKSELNKCSIHSVNNMLHSVCSERCYGKFHKLPFFSSTTTDSSPFQLIHTDL